MTHLIEGINPLTISKIVAKKYQRWGEHPLAVKRYKAKHPIKAFFGLGPQQSLFDGYIPPSVEIIVGDKCVKAIVCTSNDDAVKLARKLNKKLDNYIDMLAVAKKFQQ